MIVRELLVRLGVDYDDKGQKKAESGIQRLSGLATKLGLAYAAVKTFTFARGLVDMASAAEDVQSVLGQVFGSSLGEINAWADEQAGALQRSKSQLKEYAAGFGAVLGPMLKNEEQTKDLTKALVTRSVEINSFFSNLGYTDQEVMERLRSGLLGSTEAVDQFAINLRQENLASTAARIGIKNFSAQSDEATKVLVRFHRILEDSANAKDWPIKTAKEYNNQVAALTGQLRDLGEAIGKRLMGPATRIVEWMRTSVDLMTNLVQKSNILQVALLGLAAVAAVFAGIWILANLPIIALGVGIAALIFIVEDLYTGLEGGTSIIKDWYTAVEGADSWNKIVRTWERAKKAIGAIFSGDVRGAWNALTENTPEEQAAAQAKKKDFAARQAAGKLTPDEAKLAFNPVTLIGDAYTWMQKNLGIQATPVAPALRAGTGVPTAFGPGGTAPPPPPAAAQVPNITFNIQGNADQNTTREMERIARKVLDDSNRGLLYTTSRPVGSMTPR